MWNDLSNIWKEAFSLAWDAYTKNTIPIGAVIVNEEGKIISRGKNRIYDRESNSPLAGTQMAHAEVSAMINLRDLDHPNVNQYALFSTMEPCPMCFGTMVIMGIRELNYAAKDGYGGATELNEKLEYIKIKKLRINRESGELEVFQICLQSVFEFSRIKAKSNRVIDSWREYCNDGVELAVQLYEENYFSIAVESKKTIEVVYDEVLERYHHLQLEKIN